MRINLNEILARDDYKRMTENLKSITEEIARAIHKKMDELEIENNTNFDNGEIGVDDVVVKVITVKATVDLIEVSWELKGTKDILIMFIMLA